MGRMIDGKWTTEPVGGPDEKGRFVRRDSAFRDYVTADGSPGAGERGGFKAEPGRYHLYVSLACPWAHRALIFRAIKGLDSMISVSATHWLMGDDGWSFEEGPGVIPDPIHQARFMREVYASADPRYTGSVTVPVLWDKRTGTIVNNESSEIIRMFNSAFDQVGAAPGDYYPAELRGEIDELNARIYPTLNNGVYRAGFAKTQRAYAEAVIPLFETLDFLEARLQEHRYLCGDRITEADWRLLTTLLRFDPVYFGHFKCNVRRIVDYPNLSNYTRDLYQFPGVAPTVNLRHIKNHYYMSHPAVNPTRIVPVGPAIDYGAPHDRARLSAG